VLDALKLGTEHKIVLHIGGGYGNKREAAGRFISHYKSLDSSAGNRLVIENDDRIFNIGDVLEISKAADIPVVFDNLHNDVNPADREKTDIEWINFCRATWKNSGGTQKIHYSQPNPEKKKGAHSESIDINRFLSFYKGLSETEPDIMLEVKDKNISAIKCINCASNRGIGALENEWARYKYYVLEHSSAVYEDIRRLLKDKAAYPALEMYGLIEAAAKMPVTTGSAVNAAMHVWGYLKNKAAASDKKSFEQLLRRFNSGETDLQSVKRFLLRLAKRHGEAYLLNSYYFYL
jgi:UV DNA damage endonuclease